MTLAIRYPNINLFAGQVETGTNVLKIKEVVLHYSRTDWGMSSSYYENMILAELGKSWRESMALHPDIDLWLGVTTDYTVPTYIETFSIFLHTHNDATAVSTRLLLESVPVVHIRP